MFSQEVETVETGWLADPDVINGLMGGGRLVRVSEKGRSEIVYQAPDLDWAARRFAAVLLAKSGAWSESIMASRAVLTLVADMVHRFTDMSRFGLPNPELYRGEMRAIISSRLGNRDCIDATLATTAAAVDLNDILDRVLTDPEAERVRD